jgi:hypothetical protein
MAIRGDNGGDASSSGSDAELINPGADKDDGAESSGTDYDYDGREADGIEGPLPFAPAAALAPGDDGWVAPADATAIAAASAPSDAEWVALYDYTAGHRVWLTSAFFAPEGWI